MGQVNIRIGGSTHTVGCRDGEEDHVRILVRVMEQKVQEILASMGGQFSEARLLLHVALLLADEAHDLRTELRAARENRAPAPPVAPPAPAPDPRVAERLERLAGRIEGMSRSLDDSALLR